MNKQCIECGHVMLVPDIPLPPGYTQKCIACGKVNVVSDTYHEEEKDPSGFSSSIDDSDVIDFSSSSNSNNSNSGSAPREEFSFDIPKISIDPESQKIMDQMQYKINNLQSQITKLQSSLKEKDIHNTNQNAYGAPQNLNLNRVETNQALFCSEKSALAEICARHLRGRGISTEIIENIGDATRKISDIAYHFIFIDQQLLQGKPEGSAFLNTLNRIDLEIRRQQLTVLLTTNIDTGESQVFYQWGIDMNIHHNDLENMVELIHTTRQIKDDIYSRYQGLELVAATPLL